jgi:hypothetical protein
MTRPLRTLPLRVAPLPGEAIDSWLETMAWRLYTPLREVLPALGLRDGAARIRFPRWAVELDRGEAEDLSAVTGVAADTICAMTLSRFEGRALILSGQERQVERKRLWGRGTGSRFCPGCLTDDAGRWQLEWRLGWSFACIRHACLLADACPRCHGVARRRPHTLDCVPRPGLCALPVPGGGKLTRCGAALGEAQTLRFEIGHPVLRAQQTLTGIIEHDQAGTGVYTALPQLALAALADVRALAARALARGTDRELADLVSAELVELRRLAATAGRAASAKTVSSPLVRTGFMAPQDAASAAIGATAAMTVLGCRDIQAAGTAMRWLTAKSTTPVSPTALEEWGRGTSSAFRSVQLAAIGPDLRPSDQLRYATGSATPQDPCLNSVTLSRRAAGVPTLLWPYWSLRLSAVQDLSGGVLRPVLAALVLVCGSRLALGHAAELLGNAAKPHAVSRVLQKLHQTRHWPAIQAALTEFARVVDDGSVPINYERRRGLDYRGLLSDKEWTRLCRDADVHPGHGSRLRAARRVLFEHISGMPAEIAPAHLRDAIAADPNEVWRLPAWLTPQTRDGIERAARAFLERHSIDEPVQWQPPAHLLETLILPGPDPDAIDPDPVHHLIRHQREPITRAAELVGISAETIRYILQTHPAPPGPGKPPLSIPHAAAGAGLTRQKLVHHYVDQRESLRTIARRYGISRGSVTRLAREFDLEVRPGRERRTVERDWLVEQYEQRRRTLPEIASAIGMSTNRLRVLAVDYGIALRPRGGASHQASLRIEKEARTAPSALQPALNGPHGLERLRRFAALSSHDTFTAAAAALGTTQTVLTSQIARLEQDLGEQLLIRAERGAPMRPTPAGHAVLDALRQFDQQQAAADPA